MRRVLAVALLVASLWTGATAVRAQPDVDRLTQGQIAQLLGNRLLALEDSSVASDQGHVFLLTRERQTRQLEWFLLDPSGPRILRQGKVPFQVYQNFAVSPGGRTAIVQARFPTSLWVLSLSDGRWVCARTNDNPQRLALTSLSRLLYTDESHACSFMDRHDAEGYVVDSVLVRFQVSPFALTDQVSLRELLAGALRVAAPSGSGYQVDLLRYGRDGSCVFVLQSRAAGTKRYLLRRDPRGHLAVLDQDTVSMVPLDYDAATDRILYRTVQAGGPVVAMLAQGLRTIVSARPVVAAALLTGGRIATMTVTGNQMEVWIGTPGQVFQRALTVAGAYRAAFLRDGRRLILWNDRDLRIVRL